MTYQSFSEGAKTLYLSEEIGKQSRMRKFFNDFIENTLMELLHSNGYFEIPPEITPLSVLKQTVLNQIGIIFKIPGFPEVVLPDFSPEFFAKNQWLLDFKANTNNTKTNFINAVIFGFIETFTEYVSEFSYPKITTVIKRDGTKTLFNMSTFLFSIIKKLFFRKPLDIPLINIKKFVNSVLQSTIEVMDVYVLSNLMAEEAAGKIPLHPEFDSLAVRFAVDNMHKDVQAFQNLDQYLKTMFFGDMPKADLPYQLRTDPGYEILPSKGRISVASFFFAKKYKDKLEEILNYDRDYDYNWFGFQTIMKQYSMKFPYRSVKAQTKTGDTHTNIKYAFFEQPQQSYLRFALEVFVPDPERYFEQIIHSCNEPSRMWDENFDDLNTVPWSEGTRLDKQKTEYFEIMSRGNGDKENLTPKVTETQSKQKRVYENIRPKPIISDLLNPFSISAESLRNKYKTLCTIGQSDKVIFETFLSLYLKRRSEAQDLQILNNVLFAYNLISLKFLSPPTTTFQPGKKFISCFLVGKPGDSIPSIFAAPAEGAKLGKDGGGYSTRITDVRGVQSYINGTNSDSTGILPVLGVMDKTVKYVRQKGNGDRAGPNTVFIEPYHIELPGFLDALKTESGSNFRLDELKGAVFINELLFKRCANNGNWTLFSPNDVPELAHTFGDAFEDAYIRYENNPKIPKKVFKAKEIMMKIVETIHDVGQGACNLMHCDNFNRFSMYQCEELGVKLRSSNICNEIAQPSTINETATCVIFSACAPAFILTDEQIVLTGDLFTGFNWLNICVDGREDTESKQKPLPSKTRKYESPLDTFNNNIKKWATLEESLTKTKGKSDVKRTVAWNLIEQVSGFGNFFLSCIINQASYPSYDSMVGGFNQRAVGLGCQGFHNTLVLLDLPYDSPMAANLIFKIKEAFLFGSYQNSIDLAELFGRTPYWDTVEKYTEKKVSLDAKGILPFDLYYDFNPKLNAKQFTKEEVSTKSVTHLLEEDPNFFHHVRLFNSETLWNAPNWPWDSVRERLKKVGGKYNMQLITAMPNATSSIVTGNNPSHEPPMNIYGKQKTTSGEFTVISPTLINSLIKIGKWNKEAREQIEKGNFQKMDIPQDLKDLYKTAWDIDQKSLILLYFHAQVMTDQSQSMSVWYLIESLSKEEEEDTNVWTVEMKSTLRLMQLKKILDTIMYGATVCDTGLKTLAYYSYKGITAPSNLAEIRNMAIEYRRVLEETPDSLSSSSAQTGRISPVAVKSLSNSENQDLEMCFNCDG